MTTPPRIPRISAGSARRLAGRVVLVTGGARGQGAAHGLRVVDEGASVVLADVLDTEGEAEAERLRILGHDAHYRHLDVSDPHSWAETIAYVTEHFGRLDVLVNNAGIIHVTPIAEEPLEAWNRLLGVNLTGVFLGIQSALPLLEKSSAASIINIASIFGPAGAHGYSAYAASKAGILGLTKTAALELAPLGIRVNAVCPGGVSTPMNKNEPGGGVVPETPLGRRAHVSEIAATVAFLASDDASFITGSEFYVDGGFMAH